MPEKKRFSQIELKKIIEEEVMKEHGVVFKCSACSNLSMDKEQWLITVDLPGKTDPKFEYSKAICSYCESFPNHYLNKKKEEI